MMDLTDLGTPGPFLAACLEVFGSCRCSANWPWWGDLFLWA